MDYLFRSDVTFNIFTLLKMCPHDWNFVAMKAKAAHYTLLKDGLDIRKVYRPLDEVINDGDTLTLIHNGEAPKIYTKLLEEELKFGLNCIEI